MHSSRWISSAACLLAILLTFTPAFLRATEGPPIPKAILEKGQKSTGTPFPATDEKVETVKTENSFKPVLPPANFKPSKLEVDSDRFSFGTVFKGSEVVHSFKVKNTGGSDLIIQKVKPGCGCTYVKHQKVIEPGQAGEITLKIDTNKLRAGKTSKWADIHTNDPENLRKRVFMEGTVATAFTVIPNLPRVECVRGEDECTLKVVLQRAVDEEFTVKGVKATNERVIPELIEKEAGKLYHIEVRANTESDNKNTYFSDRLEVDIVNAQGKAMTQNIPVTIRLKNRISVKPLRTVYFRRPEVQKLRSGGAPVTKEIVVKSEVTRGDHSFKVLKVELSEDRFKTRIVPVQEGKEYKVEVQIDQLPDDPALKSLKGDLIIHTDDPAQPKIEMRVLAFI